MNELIDQSITYTNGLGVSHMVIDCPDDPEIQEFDMRMLENNAISGLLKCDMKQIDGKTAFLYDISGKQSLEKLYEIRKMSFADLKNFIISLKALSADLSEYLLAEERVLFHQKCIFTGHSRERFYFCYYPGDLSEPGYTPTDLFNEFLSVIDYNDKKVIDLAFGLTRLCQDGSFSLADATALLEEIEPSAHQGTDPGDEEFNEDIRAIDVPDSKPSKHSKDTPGTSSVSGSAVQGTFRNKARQYFKNHEFSEIFDDINNGKIFRKIRSETLPEETFPVFSAAELQSEGYEEYTLSPLPESFMETSSYMNEPESDTISLDIGSITARRLSGTGVQAGLDIPLEQFPFTIGKSEESCDFRLDDAAISRVHMRIIEDSEEPGIFYIEDENSKNGTYINGTRLAPYEKRQISSGDLIRIAREEFYFL